MATTSPFPDRSGHKWFARKKMVAAAEETRKKLPGIRIALYHSEMVPPPGVADMSIFL